MKKQDFKVGQLWIDENEDIMRVIAVTSKTVLGKYDETNMSSSWHFDGIIRDRFCLGRNLVKEITKEKNPELFV